MKISVFGNQNLKIDSLPVKIIPALQEALPNFEFIHQDPNEDIMPVNTKNWWIIDTVQGIDKVTVIDNIKAIKRERSCSLHDYDLGFELALIKKINPDLRIRIIGVPMDAKEEEVVLDIVKILNKVNV